MTAPLAIADGAASGQYAVDFSWNEGASHSNGLVRVGSLPEPDSDNDGLPDWWEELYFEGPTIADPAVDSDDDGMTNLQEYVARTNPRERTSVLQLTAAAFEVGGFKVFFPTVSGVVYRLLRSDDLSSWAPVGPDIPGTGATGEATDPDAPRPDEARCYRILVVR